MAVVPRLLLLAASSGSLLLAHPLYHPCPYRPLLPQPLCSPSLLCHWPEPQPPLTLAQPCPLPASILLYYTEVYLLPRWLACLWAKSFQSYPILCDPMDYSPRGFCVHGILQARTLEWVAVPSFRGSSPPRDGTCISCSFCIAGGFFIIEPLRTTN